MKYKWMGLGACAVVLIVSVFAPLLFKGHEKKERVHQHKQTVPTEMCTDVDDGGLCTYLPIVEINTEGQTIPGEAIHKDGEETRYTFAENGEKTIKANMKVIGVDSSEYHHANGDADVFSKIRIRIRGNSSRSFDKPSYAIRLIDEEDNNAPQSIMGMDEHHEWVLYGPWLDKTAI